MTRSDSFFYAAVETEAWGGEVVYVEDGPPNAGEPIIQDVARIWNLEPPRVSAAPCLARCAACDRAAEG